MPDQFKTKEEKEIVVKYYEDKIFAIDDQIETLQKERKIITARITELGAIPAGSFADLMKNVTDEITMMYGEPYSATWTIVLKSEYILRHIAKIVSTTKEIVEYMNNLEGGLFTETAKRDLQNKVAATLKQKVDKKLTFARIETANSEFLYGLLEWFAGSRLKSEYFNIRHPLKRMTRNDHE